MHRIFCFWLCFAVLASGVAGAADVVSVPLRHFGLGELRRATLSPQGEHMVTFGQSAAFLWDFPNGTVERRLADHRSAVTAATFTADGQQLLTAGNDLLIRTWEVPSGKPLQTLAGHKRLITSVAASTHGPLLLSASEDNTARLWSLDTGEVIQTFHVQGSQILRAFFASNDTCVVTLDAAFQSTVRVWDVASGLQVRQFATNANDTLTMDVLPDGRVITGGADKVVRIWDLNSGEVMQTLTGAPGTISFLAFSAADSLIIAGTAEGAIRAWSYPSGALLHQFTAEPLVSVAASSAAGEILTGHADHVVRVKKLATGATVRQMQRHASSTATGVAFSPDGTQIVSSAVEAATRVWRRTNAEPVRLLMGHPSGSSTALYSPAGNLVLTTRNFPQAAVQLWDSETGAAAGECVGHTGFILSAAFSADGSRIATGATDGTVRLWNTNGQSLRTFTAANTWVKSVAISPDGRWLLGGCSDSIARLWDAQSGAVLQSFELAAGPVQVVRFSPNGKDALVAWQEGVLQVFDPESGKLDRTILPPPAFLESLAYSPDGRFLLVGLGWPMFGAALMEASSGELVRAFAGHTAPVGAVAFNAAGNLVVTAGDDVRLWTIADVLATLRSEVTKDGLELRWDQGTLEQASAPGGQWAEVTGAASPWQVKPAGPAGFFRVRTPAE